jgi:DNA repair exonuclease SbcCD ATPase subunit
MENGNRTFKPAFCSTYEDLLAKCQEALFAWSTRREEASRLGIQGKELGAELVRLQANFAKSYASLQKHTRECPVCEFVAHLEAEGFPIVQLVNSNESHPV